MQRSGFRRAPLALAVLLAFAAATTQAEVAASGHTPLQVSIAAQPLAQALNDLARQTGMELIVQPALVAGRTAPAVAGLLTARQALDSLLAGTALVAVIDGTTITVRSAPVTQGDRTLTEVRVQAHSERTNLTEHSGSYTSGLAGTATPLALSLRETPQSVTVMTRQRMDDQGLTQLGDIVTQAPGLVMSQGGNQGSDSSPIYARGFQVDTYMVDGVRQVDSNYTSIFQTSDMAMFDRVEIVRGATGLMNGIGTPGAAINLIRKRPTAEFQAVARAELGSWEYRRLEGDISAPLNAAGSLRGRLVVSAQENGSYIDRLQESKKLLYSVVEADLAPRTQLRAGASLQLHDATGHARGGLPAYYADGSRAIWRRSDSAAASWAYSERHNAALFAALEHRFDNDWQLKATVNRAISHYDELLGYASGGNPNRATGAGVNLWAGRWTAKPRQDSLDVQASGKFHLLGREHDLAFGAQVSRTTYLAPSYTLWYHTGWDAQIPNIYTWDGSSPGAPGNPSIGTYGSDERLNSAYATARFRPTDALSVLLGGRVTDWGRYQTSSRFSTGLTTITDRNESGEFTPYLGVVYDFDKHWSVYGNYTSIFKPQSNKTVAGDYLDPQTGDSYELGIKGAFFGDRLNISAAFYKANQDNLAVSIPNVFAPDGSQAYTAVSGTSTRGFEVEATGELQPGWQIAAGLTRNMTQDRLGARLLTNVPQNTVKLFSSYRIAGIGKGLTLGGGVRWQSSIYSDNQGPSRVRFTQPGYAVVDLVARYAVSPKVVVSANLYNAFDKSYYATTGSAYYGAPRNVRVGLEAQF